MSSQITEAQVKQFSATIWFLAHQRGSKLQGKVRNESLKGKAGFFDSIGAVTAVRKTSRHSATPQLDTPHGRRMVTMADYEWADLIDDQDKLRMLFDPTSAYAQAASWAFGRSKDDVIIAAAFATSYAGEEGTTAVSLASAQKLVAFDGSTTTGVGLNVDTLKKAKRYFDDHDVIAPLFMVVDPAAIENLLNETEVTSSDFNVVKALVNGEVNSYMGFEFIKSTRLARAAAATTYTVTSGLEGAGTGTLAANESKCYFACTKEALLLAVGEDFVGKVDVLPEKSYSTQVYARMSIGATRMEEAQLLAIYAKSV